MTGRGRPKAKVKPVKRDAGTGTVKWDQRGYFKAYLPADAAGKREYVGSDPDRDRALALVRERMRRRGLVDADDPADTVRALALRWLDDYMHTGSREVSTRTVKSDRVMTHIVNDPIGRVPLDALRIDAVQAWLRRKADTGYETSNGERKSYSLSTLRDMRADLSQIMLWAIPRGHVDRNPCLGALLPDNVDADTTVRAMEPGDVQRFIKECRNTTYRNAVMVLACVTTGKRENELAGLHWSDIDFDAGSIHVTRAMKFGTGGKPVKIGPTKTGTEHLPIGLPKALAEALIEHRAEQDADRELAGKYWSRAWPNDLVFRTQLGTPHYRGNVLRTMRLILRDAGLDESYTIRDLRATYLTMMSDTGRSLQDIMRQAGHKDERMALKHYIKTRKGSVVRAGADMMDELTG